MHKVIDILASGIHDSKNQLFYAESRLAALEQERGIELGEIRYAIEAAASRLNRTLTAYRLMRHDAHLALIPTVIADLCEEVAIDQREHLHTEGIALELDCQTDEAWPIDRDLVEDMLNNAVQNAGRHARARIRLSATSDADGLCIRVEDDGPGFATLPPHGGIGLKLAERLAELHQRNDRQGRITLGNGGPWGGACFELRLP